MALKTFTFNGKTSSQYGLRVLDASVYTYPERNIETFSVPGRNGDILYDMGSFNNIVISYHVLFPKKNLARQTQRLKALLYQATANLVENNLKADYFILTDTYDPDFYRYAYFAGPANWETMMNLYGETTLNFVCKPQKYYKNYYTDTVKSVENGTRETFAVEDQPPITSDVPRPLTKGKFYPLIKITVFGRPTEGGTLSFYNGSGGGEFLTISDLDTVGDGYIQTMYLDCFEEQLVVGSNVSYGNEIINDHIQFAAIGSSAYQFPYWSASDVTTSRMYIENNLGLDISVSVEWRCWTI